MDVLVLGDFYTTDRGSGGAAAEHAAEASARLRLESCPRRPRSRRVWRPE